MKKAKSIIFLYILIGIFVLFIVYCVLWLAAFTGEGEVSYAPNMTTAENAEQMMNTNASGDVVEPSQNSNTNINSNAEESEQNTEVPVDTITKLPEQIHHTLPFTPQAPNANWDQPYQDACEEASLLMAHAGLKNIPTLTASSVDDELLSIIDFETTQKGWGHDVTIAQLQEVALEYYGYADTEVAVDTDISIDEIKRYLADDKVVIAPMAGQLLKNPYFTSPGPEYHMLVIIGYDEKTQEFITNDPGTKRGKDYRYSYTTLFNAIHDWIGSKETIQQGPKHVLVMSIAQ